MRISGKIIAYLLIFGLILQSQFFGYTFAGCWKTSFGQKYWEDDCEEENQENKCPACNSTPNEMQMYIDFEVELLGILRGISEEKQVYGTNRNAWLFNGGILSLPNAFYKSTISQIQKDFDSELKALRAVNITEAILKKMTITGLRDTIGSIQILFKDESFVRDYKTLQEIDMSINDVTREMGILGIRKGQVSSSIQKDILNLQAKYSKLYGGQYPIFDRVAISQSVKNKEIMAFLLDLNSTMKSMLLTIGEDTPVLDSKVSNLENVYFDGNIVIEINKDYVKKIVDAYSCAKRSMCSNSLKATLQDTLDLGRYEMRFSNAADTVKQANKNLKEAFGANNQRKSSDKYKSEVLTDRQVELLGVAYGINAIDLTKSQEENMGSMLNQAKEETEPLSSAIEDVVNYSKEAVEYTKYLSKNLGKYLEYIGKEIVVAMGKLGKGILRLLGFGEKQQKMYINDLSDQEKQERLSTVFWQEIMPQPEKDKLFIETMQGTINKVLIEMGEDKEVVVIGQNQETHYFIEIGSYIHLIVEDIIGDKSRGLIKNLGETCTYQCSNHGTQNCYTK